MKSFGKSVVERSVKFGAVVIILIWLIIHGAADGDADDGADNGRVDNEGNVNDEGDKNNDDDADDDEILFN